MRRYIAILLLAAMLMLSSCALYDAPQSKTYYDYFDTVVTVIGYDDDGGFDTACGGIEAILQEYDQMLDIYSSTSAVSGVNAAAGKEAVAVPEELIDIIEYSIEAHTLTEGKCNVAFGAVLSIWHDYRTRALDGDTGVPAYGELLDAAAYCDIGDVKLDREGGTVYLDDGEMSLDLGAVAKGWIADRIKDYLVESGKDGYAVSVGGTVVTVGEKPNGEAFVVGVENPDEESGEAYVARVALDGGALATSGSYQRYYDYDGVRYHHIIDPDTLYPENELLSVTIRADSAALADALSTAVFNMSLDEGEAFVDSLDGVEALWVTSDGEIHKSDGFNVVE